MPAVTRRHRSGHLVAVTAAAIVLGACGAGESAAESPPVIAAPVASSASAPAVVETPDPTPRAPAPKPTSSTSTTTSSTTTSTSSTTTTTTPPTTIAPTTTTVRLLTDPALPSLNAAFDTLARNNAAASMTVMRDGAVVFGRASGTTIDGAPATSDSPMVVASVSKMVTAFMVARLEQQGAIDVDAPMPWATIGITPHPGWDDVTVRELLDHTSGMVVARTSWFTGVGECADYLPSLLTNGPLSHRGRWTYSNGNYCALGRLVEAVTGEPLDVAAQRLLFDPLGVGGIHLTTNGLLPGDLPHSNNTDRLSRLGGAGIFVVSTDDLAAMLAATTVTDFDSLRPPGLMVDQYGWGHTGTILGAGSCVWVTDFGRTVIAATIAGGAPDTGGGICDHILPALSRDFDIGDGARPNRTP